jgi:hypothetical protein
MSSHSTASDDACDAGGSKPRTRSHCCSDKLARWLAVGLQGALLSHFIAEPLRLASVTVAEEHWGAAGDPSPASPASPASTASAAAAPLPSPSSPAAMSPQLEALQWALVGRAGAARRAAQAALGAPLAPPELFVGACSPAFEHSRAAMAARLQKSCVPERGAGPAPAPAPAPAPLTATAGTKRKASDISHEHADERSNAPPAETHADASSASSVPPVVAAVRGLVVGGSRSGAAIVPCGHFTNALAGWRGDGALDVEVLSGATGELQGATQRQEPARRASRLCKARLAAEFKAVWRDYRRAVLGDAAAVEAGAGAGDDSSAPAAAGSDEHATYRDCKHCSHGSVGAYRRAVAAFHAATADGDDASFGAWQHCEPEFESFLV